jgi:ethanolamine utilization protein EutN
MQIGQVVGHAVATVKHPSMQGWRLLLVQPQGAQQQADGEPILAIDKLGAGVGSRVIVTSEGGAVRQVMGAANSPVRWMVLGMCDA